MPVEREIKTMRIFVQGFVQGVNYRRWMQEQATDRGIRGWVRNRSDGTVEAVLQGEEDTVDDLIRACSHGPDLARVDSVHAEAADYDGREGFSVEKTYRE